MMESTISVVSSEALLTLFGACDQHVRRIRNALGVSITARDDHIHVAGPESAVASATAVLEQLQACATQLGTLSPDDVTRVLAGLQEGEAPAEPSTIDIFRAGRQNPPQEPRPGPLRGGHSPQRHCVVLRAGRHRQDLPGRGRGGSRPEAAVDPQDRVGSARRRGRRYHQQSRHARLHQLCLLALTNGTLTITQAVLTITANSATKVYGQTVTFAGTEFVASGLANSDTVTSVSLASSGAAASAPVAGSPYAIVPDLAVGSGLANYNIAYANGSLTLSPASSFQPAGFLAQPLHADLERDLYGDGDFSRGHAVGQCRLPGERRAVQHQWAGQRRGLASAVFLPVGTNAIAGQYAGDGNFLPSSAGLPQVVQSLATYSQTNAVLAVVNNLDGTLT